MLMEKNQVSRKMYVLSASHKKEKNITERVHKPVTLHVKKKKRKKVWKSEQASDHQNKQQKWKEHTENSSTISSLFQHSLIFIENKKTKSCAGMMERMI